jgi:hypothetical protein
MGGRSNSSGGCKTCTNERGAMKFCVLLGSLKDEKRLIKPFLAKKM